MKIRILGVDYDIAETECVSKEEMRLGEINVMEQKIKIDSSLQSDAKSTTLLHEIIHGILFACGLDWQEENLTQSLATGLYQVLRENQELLAFLGLLGERATSGSLRSLAGASVT
jgi:ssRNA-specific RNase YbeY (16S rRNA maturation enzyme)